MRKLLPILFLAFAAIASGQSLSIDELQAKAKAAKIKDVIIQYDKFKDESMIASKPYNLIGGMEGALVAMTDSMARDPRYGSGQTSGMPTSLNIAVGFTFNGKTLTSPPDKLFIFLMSNSSNWIFLKGDKTLYFLYDDEQRLKLPAVDQGSDIRGYRGVSEQLAFEISYGDLEKLSKAKKVELKVGPIPRRVKLELVQRFGSLLSLVSAIKQK